MENIASSVTPHSYFDNRDLEKYDIEGLQDESATCNKNGNGSI
jgi:hypothetical protein